MHLNFVEDCIQRGYCPREDHVQRGYSLEGILSRGDHVQRGYWQEEIVLYNSLTQLTFK